MGASVVVAASNSSDEAKSRADIVCHGIDDQIQLMESIAKGQRVVVDVDINPSTQKAVECYGRHSAKWLPGDYYLSGTLEIPACSDVAIDAQGSYFHFLPRSGDAVVIAGMNRCRYNFGTIESASTGAAIRIRPSKDTPALMSFVTFMGLVGRNQAGVGLWLDPSEENVCTNRFEGTDISGFDIGVLVDDAGSADPSIPGSGKCDTNHFWFSYVRMCNVCVQERSHGIDCGEWNVNIDASIPNSVAMRTGAAYGKWYIIMGTWDPNNSRAIVLDPGARHNVIEVHPPVEDFRWEDSSGNDTNVILTSKRPPYVTRPPL